MTGSQSESQKKPQGKIYKRVWIKASTEVVYKALTESRELIHWFCDRVSCDPREGGELTVYWRSGKSSQKGRAVFTRIIPESVVELLWTDDGDGVRESSSNHTLTYEIRSKQGVTELAMTDNDESASDSEGIAILDQGWNSVLLELKDYCERRERLVRVRPQPR